MKKFVIVMLAAVMLLVICAGCNKQIFDTTFAYERAVLSLPDGTVIEGKVQSWTDYAEGDQIQVKIDGKQYLVHSMNVVLIAE